MPTAFAELNFLGAIDLSDEAPSVIVGEFMCVVLLDMSVDRVQPWVYVRRGIFGAFLRKKPTFRVVPLAPVVSCHLDSPVNKAASCDCRRHFRDGRAESVSSNPNPANQRGFNRG